MDKMVIHQKDGTDYWTSSDIATIEAYCDSYIDSHITQAIGGAY